MMLTAIAIHASETIGDNLSPMRANFHASPRKPVLCASNQRGA